MNSINKDEVKKILDEPPVPENISPESVKNRLDIININKNQKNIHLSSALKWFSGIAACAVLLSIGSFVASKIQDNSGNVSSISGNYTTAAVNYKQVYKYMKKYIDNIEDTVYEAAADEAEMEYDIAAADGAALEKSEVTVTETAGINSESDSEIYEVYNQEVGVLEGDIVQTDGKRIYSVNSDNTSLIIHIAETDGKNFTTGHTLSLIEYLPETVSSGNISSMYLENGRLIIAIDTIEYQDSDEIFFYRTHVLIFDTGEELKLIGDYAQDGNYNDIRLMKDGTLYIISSYNWTHFYEDNNYEECIPTYYTNKNKCKISPDEILLPETDSINRTEYNFSSEFTNIGSINVFSDSPSELVDFKALAGFSGQLYCSLDNIYLASDYWTEKGTYTDFTRININNGSIVPEASTNVEGYVNDQFSMSEYNGFFRAVVSRSNVNGIENDNAVYVFDMELNKISETISFGENEIVKSANFQGDLAYVVTYRQTDPLYAIDLSDPYSPAILDEYKITGYSSYMQQWNNALLLGFGIDADEYGNENGLKLVMFDNSDPNDLTECGIMKIHTCDVARYDTNNELGGINSPAEYDRKALLISPDKNLIAVPFSYYANYFNYDNNYCYGIAIYSYDNGEFITRKIIYSSDDVTRALYIDNTLFIVGDNEIISVDIETMLENDRIYF